MRNLKRALSLALASIMLLGMMVTGAGAASTSFTDFDQIVNQEAAEVTSGLKIFEGYTDGSFGPEKEVTRAEMAVIICKILNGSNVDPANFSGVTKFTDVPSWAEGYVNYCNSMGIVVGVGDNKFDPNRTVSTVEAATMLLKALGYFIEEDQLGADWKTVVTGRALNMKLYGNLTLGVDEPLTRDNVAELLFHTLFAQRVAYDDNRHLYVKNTDRDVVVTNGTSDRDNTLAMNTFGMWYIDGVVTANSCTDDTLSETVNNAPRTNVVFDNSADYLGGNNAGEYPFEYTTGLDMIGHAARVYYSMERNAPVVYAIADRATKVEYVTYDDNTTNLANAANQAGFRRNTILELSKEKDYKLNYSWNVPVGSLDLTPENEPAKTLIVISNSSDLSVDVVIALDQYLDTVKNIYTRNEETDYDMTTQNASRLEVPHDTFEKGDYVIVTDVGNEGKVLNFQAPELVTANITKITGVSNQNATVKSIVADGVEYVGSPVEHHKRGKAALDNTTNFEAIETIGESTLILDLQGKCIGLGEPEGLPNYAYAAQFGVWHTTSGINTKDKLTVKLYFADGTSGAYQVNTSVSRNNTFYNYNQGDLGLGATSTDLAALNAFDNTGDYGTKAYRTPVSIASNGDLTVYGSGLGIYRATVRADGTVVLQALETDYAQRAKLAKARLVAKHSTLVVTEEAANLIGETYMNAPGKNVTINSAADGSAGALYQTAKTVYFYTNGKYDDESVAVRIGVANAESFVGSDKGGDGVNNEYLQVFAKQNASNNNRYEVSAMLVWGVEVDTNKDLYFYKEGNYHITTKDGVEVANGKAANDELAVTFDLYKASGEAYSHTFTNGGKYYTMDEAISMVREIPTGFYTIGKDKLSEERASDQANHKSTKGDYTYVLNAKVDHVDAYNNIFTQVEEVGGITGETLVVDATGKNEFNSVGDIANHSNFGDTVTISYCYKHKGSDMYEVKAIFVTGYAPKGTDIGGNVDKDLIVTYDKNTMGLRIYDKNQYASFGPTTITTTTSVMSIMTAVKAAYQAAGFTVTNEVVLGAGIWGMTISGGGLANTMNVTNATSGQFGMLGYYIPTTITPLAKITLNGKVVGYYANGETVTMNVGKNTVILDAAGGTVANPTAADGKFSYTVKAADFASAPADVAFAEAIGVTVTSGVDAIYYVDGRAFTLTNDGSTSNNVPAGTKLILSASDASTTKMWQFKTATGKIGDRVTGQTTVEYTVPATGSVSIDVDEIIAVYAGPGVKVADGSGNTLVDGGSYGKTEYFVSTDAAAFASTVVTGSTNFITETAVVKPAGIKVASGSEVNAAGAGTAVDGLTTHLSIYAASQVNLTGVTATMNNTAKTPVSDTDFVSVGAVLNLTGTSTTYNDCIVATPAGGTAVNIGKADGAKAAVGTYTMTTTNVAFTEGTLGGGGVTPTPPPPPANYNVTLPATGLTASYTDADGNTVNLTAGQATAVPANTVITLADVTFDGTWYTKFGATEYVKLTNNTITVDKDLDFSAVADKYHKVSAVQVDVTTNTAAIATNLGGATITASAGTDPVYVKEGGAISVSFTIDKDLAGALKATLSATGLTVDTSTFKSETQLADTGDYTGKTDSVTAKAWATADVSLKYVISV